MTSVLPFGRYLDEPDTVRFRLSAEDDFGVKCALTQSFGSLSVGMPESDSC